MIAGMRLNWPGRGKAECTDPDRRVFDVVTWDGEIMVLKEKGRQVSQGVGKLPVYTGVHFFVVRLITPPFFSDADWMYEVGEVITSWRANTLHGQQLRSRKDH